MIKVLGLCGPAQSGKSTMAMRLITTHGFRVFKFAEPIKNMMKGLGLTEFELNDAVAKEKPHGNLCGRSPRYAMQTLGTEWGRQLIGPTIWLDRWMQNVAHLVELGAKIVADDLRFENEAVAIRQLGGVVVRIERQDYWPPHKSHASEQFDFEPDAVIKNEGKNLNDFFTTVDTFVGITDEAVLESAPIKRDG